MDNPMKRLLAILGLLLPLPVGAQNNVKSWEVRKSERFRPLTDQQRMAITEAVPAAAAERPKQQRRILVFYRCEGFVHSSIPHGNFAVQEMGRKTGAFRVDLADSYDSFSTENLDQYDCILLNNTSGMRFAEPSQHDAFLDFVEAGKGLVGFHGASDNFGRHPECRALVGGQFNGHPWNAGGMWAFKLDDPNHVLNRAFVGKGFWHRDEIYQYKPDSYQGPEVLRLLVSLDMNQEAVSSRIDDGPREVPVSWIRSAGEGRVFYTNFGHREETYQSPVIVKHMLDGIQYALGDLQADSVPTATTEPTEPALAPARD
jgi:type 1 glutamine amidotransferase